MYMFAHAKTKHIPFMEFGHVELNSIKISLEMFNAIHKCWFEYVHIFTGNIYTTIVCT